MQNMLQLVLTHSAKLFLLPFILLATACGTPVPAGKIPGIAKSPAFAPPMPLPQVTRAEVRALQTLVALQDRLYRVAAPLLVNNTELCKNNARNLLGFTAKNKYSYSADFIEAAHDALGLDEQLKVRDILAGSGAAQNGIQSGDTLLAVDDVFLPEGHNAERQAAALLAPLVNDRSSVTLRLRRNQNNLSLTIPLTRACAFNLKLGNVDQVNAYSDGHQIMVTRGMMDFAQTDEELAYVLAREIAHNTLGHWRKQRMSATMNGIIDNLARLHPDMSTMVGLAGVKPMPQELDAAADTLALYLVARANAGIEHAPAFWQRLAVQYPATALDSYTAIHPKTTYRLAAITKTIADIKKKRANKKPLVP